MGRRKRRTAEQARAEILSIARQIVLEEGARALKLQRIAKVMGVSHPAVLHHFPTVQELLVVLQQDLNRTIRDNFLQTLKAQQSKTDRFQRIDEALAAISDPQNGRILAVLLSMGQDPFLPFAEQGLSTIVDKLSSDRNYSDSELKNVLLLSMLCMYADGMIGSFLRQRLFSEPQDPTQFRRWMLSMIRQHLERTADHQESEQPK